MRIVSSRFPDLVCRCVYVMSVCAGVVLFAAAHRRHKEDQDQAWRITHEGRPAVHPLGTGDEGTDRTVPCGWI